MLLVSECVARAALMRTESRGGHTRDDHPNMEPQWRNRLLVCSLDETTDEDTADEDTADSLGVRVEPKPQVPMREDLLELFERSELEKYYTEVELAKHSGRRG
jgi:succinate dehydrogenase / fumarate reductase flavoprotein subunit